MIYDGGGDDGGSDRDIGDGIGSSRGADSEGGNSDSNGYGGGSSSGGRDNLNGRGNGGDSSGGPSGVRDSGSSSVHAAECNERDIIFDDSTHEGTILFNNVIECTEKDFVLDV